jgi:crotonobetainyl-CoA:carnitine CoA-transferase CaiB-like acyl-CoA transferase
MTVRMPHPQAPAPVTLISNPLKLSETPVSYRAAPPTLGADTADILKNSLAMGEEDIQRLKSKGII